MLRRVPRNLRRAVILAVLLAVTATVWQSWTSGTPGIGGYVQTPFGPLGPADRDLLVKVRLAGLWEQPTGQQAQQQASSAQVKEVGAKISAEHAELDARTRTVADQLGVLLPSSASPQQIAWMNEISSKTGSDYDRTFVQRLREAHGIVLPVLAEVRAGTQNELVRAFAIEADAFVSRHMDYLESTGLVDHAALPHPDSPGLFSIERGPCDRIVPALVFLATLLAAAGLVAAVRKREAGGRRGNAARGAAAAPAPPRPPLAMISLPAPRVTETGPRHAIRR
jgi:predicted outer membrane protein